MMFENVLLTSNSYLACFMALLTQLDDTERNKDWEGATRYLMKEIDTTNKHTRTMNTRDEEMNDLLSKIVVVSSELIGFVQLLIDIKHFYFLDSAKITVITCLKYVHELRCLISARNIEAFE